MELVLLSLASGGAVLFFLYQWDRLRLDKAGAFFLLVFPLVGAFSVLPGLVFYVVADALIPGTSGRWGQVLFIWTVNAPVEELAKYLCFAIAATWLRSLKEPQDGSLQGAATGLGFGLVENFLYGLDGGWQLLLLRSLVSLPGHVIYGAVWGGYHGFEHYQGRGTIRRRWIPLLALVPAIFSHAVFNTLVLVEAPLGWALCGDALTLAFGIFLFLRLREASPSQLRRPLKEWRRAIPETEHALAMNPHSAVLKQRLSAYLLAAGQPDRAYAVLEGLPEVPWTRFYRDAARQRLNPAPVLPASASLNPELFRVLSGG